MAGTAAKVIFFIWMLSIKEGHTQEQPIPNTNQPSESSYYNREFTNGNDAIEMGRTAAEDMGSLMASPPVNLIHSNRGKPDTASDRQEVLYQNNLFPSFGQARDSSRMSEPQFVCYQYVDATTVAENQGRNAGRAVSPMTLHMGPVLPASTSPLGGLPAIPPLALPIIQALLPAVNMRRQHLLPVPRLPLIPPIQPLAAVRPLGLPPLKRTIGRSYFTPYSLPLVTYA